MDPRTLKYIADNRLEPCMNNTKWRELISEITSNEDFDPPVNIKWIYETGNNNSFSLVWWDQVEQEGFERIEWIQIKSLNTEHTGRLADAQKTDYTELIKTGLDKHSIRYEYEQGIFTVYGYRRMN